MQQNPYPLPDPEEESDGITDGTLLAASAMDCTGLMPAPPEDAAELEAYNSIYRIYPYMPDRGDI